MEIWNVVKDLDWSLVASTGNVSGWPNRLWKMDKHYQWLGSSGGSGLGYGAPAAAGAALANKSLGRFSVTIQGDGDMMYAPGVLWTCAHHSIPLMYVMHNNRGYHQEVMHVQRLANRRNAGGQQRQGLRSDRHQDPEPGHRLRDSSPSRWAWRESGRSMIRRTSGRP